jgi:hypothetical protein
MSLIGVVSAFEGPTLAGMSTQDAQTMQSIANAFKKHESDLKSGDLSAAKQDYVMLK